MICGPNLLSHFSYTTLCLTNKSLTHGIDTYLIKFYFFCISYFTCSKYILKKQNTQHIPLPILHQSLPATSTLANHHHHLPSFEFLFFCLISKLVKLLAPIFWSRSINSSHKVKWVSLEVWLFMSFMVFWVGKNVIGHFFWSRSYVFGLLTC